MNLQSFICGPITQHASASSSRARLPIIGVDECANHPAVRTALARAVRNDLADRTVALWSQLRRRSNGSFVMLTGAPIRGALPSEEEYGVPVKGYSCPDEQIALLLVSQLIASDRVILLSEDTRSNRSGITRLLLTEIRPALQACKGHRFGILAFMKKGKTSWESYAVALLARLQSPGVHAGLEYVKV